MPDLKLVMDGDGAWPDLAETPEKIIHVTEGISMTRLTNGMASGKSSVAIRLNLPDGRVVIAETSMELFQSAARAFRVKEETAGGL